MKILTVDIGTGTQDIYLYDSELDIENGFKLVLPSPTMRVHRRLQQALPARRPILLTGYQMGGGPSAWAIEEFARAGIPVFMTPPAAATINDELEKVQTLGIQIVSEDEARELARRVETLELRDFDFSLIAKTFQDYGVSLDELGAIAVAVFDHGNAPAGVSDRQFRFDYLDEQIRKENSLFAFAHLSDNIPAQMTRLQSVADSTGASLPCPLIVMDTAPAAILGAKLDRRVMQETQTILCNVGNFHTLAFRLGENGIEGVFEHHTGEIDLPKLEGLLRRLADGTLKHADVFEDMGHGALMYSQQPFPMENGEMNVVVTGPRRNLFQPCEAGGGHVRPYYAAPFGDMMIAGCFGLLSASAELLPETAEPIKRSLRTGKGNAPWDIR